MTEQVATRVELTAEQAAALKRSGQTVFNLTMQLAEATHDRDVMIRDLVAAGVSQVEVAEAAGLTRGRIHQITR